MVYKQHPILKNYSLSKCGEITWLGNCKTKKINSSGYWIMRIKIKGKRKDYLVHRLVWETWVGVIPSELQINHIDGNKLNTHLSNLELVTGRDNMRHASRIGLISKRKLNWNDARTIRELYSKGNIYQKDIAKLYRISQRMVSKITTKQKWFE